MRATNHRKTISKEIHQINPYKKQEKILHLKTREFSSSQNHEHNLLWEKIRKDQGYERCNKCDKTRLEIEQQIKTKRD